MKTIEWERDEAKAGFCLFVASETGTRFRLFKMDQSLKKKKLPMFCQELTIKDTVSSD